MAIPPSKVVLPESNLSQNSHQPFALDELERVAPPLSCRKRDGTGRLTVQLVLLRALRPVTSSNNVRHARIIPSGLMTAVIGHPSPIRSPLPAPPHAHPRFRQFAPALTLLLPSTATVTRATSRTILCAFTAVQPLLGKHISNIHTDNN